MLCLNYLSLRLCSAKVIKLREGKDVTIAANGITAAMTVEAGEILAKQGIDAEILYSFC